MTPEQDEPADGAIGSANLAPSKLWKRTPPRSLTVDGSGAGAGQGEPQLMLERILEPENLTRAWRQVRATMNAGYRHVVDIDLSKFFDRVNHDILMARVARKVKDKRVLRLIGRYLRAGEEINGDIHPKREGEPVRGHFHRYWRTSP